MNRATSIIVSPKLLPRPCVIEEISGVRARLKLERSDKLPQRFILLLTANGSARRLCETQWQEDCSVTVEFIQRDFSGHPVRFPNYLDATIEIDWQRRANAKVKLH